MLVLVTFMHACMYVCVNNFIHYSNPCKHDLNSVGRSCSLVDMTLFANNLFTVSLWGTCLFFTVLL